MSKYKILTSKTSPDLETQVNAEMEKGWTPSGDIQISRIFVPGNGREDAYISQVWVQPMMMNKKETKK